MTDKPTALRLADELKHFHGDFPTCTEAAAELRRLHASNTELLDELKRQADTVADIKVAMRLFGKMTIAEACAIAEEAARAAIAKAEGSQK